MEPVTHLNHPTVLNTLCYFELLRRLGFMEKSLSLATDSNENTVWVRVRLKTQGGLAVFTTGRWGRRDREALGEDPLELLGRARAHYEAQADRSGPLYAWWVAGEFETTKAQYIRNRCADNDIFVPPNTLKVSL